MSKAAFLTALASGRHLASSDLPPHSRLIWDDPRNNHVAAKLTVFQETLKLQIIYSLNAYFTEYLLCTVNLQHKTSLSSLPWTAFNQDKESKKKKR